MRVKEQGREKKGIQVEERFGKIKEKGSTEKGRYREEREMHRER